MLRLAYLDSLESIWTIKKVGWAPSLGYNPSSTISLTKKEVEVFLLQSHIPSEISNQRILFEIDDIIDNQYIIYTTGYFPNHTFYQRIINIVILIFIESLYRQMGHLGYQIIL